MRHNASNIEVIYYEHKIPKNKMIEIKLSYFNKLTQKGTI